MSMNRSSFQLLESSLSRSNSLLRSLSHTIDGKTDEEAVNAKLNALAEQAKKIETALEALDESCGPAALPEKLRNWGRKMLDMSLRNPLLNMRVGRNAISIPSEDIARTEDSLDDGEELIFDQKELKGIYRTVRTEVEETGTSTLFMVLGTLRWQQQTDGKQYLAPLLLMPLDIVPAKGGRYAIRKRDEETRVNTTLLEFLHQNNDISVEGIDPLPKDDHGVDVSLVLHRFAEAIQEQEGWEVEEKAYIGLFSFAKYILWNDLRAHTSFLLDNLLVKSLLDGRLEVPDIADPADAATMDTQLSPDSIALPLPADSSQIEAVVDADRGRSFVIYGPPGTGKSQTITNIIANAACHGKRVLFVAQKKVALEVVEHRLTEIGLAPFCLELHSNKTTKAHFLHQMQEALDAVGKQPAEEYHQMADRLFAERLAIDTTVKALHRKQDDGLALHVCIERYLQTEAAPLSLPKDFAVHTSLTEAEAIDGQILMLDAATQILGMPAKDFPLYGLYPKPKPAPRPGAYVSPYLMGDTVEKLLPTLPDIITRVKEEVERAKKMNYLRKTPREYLESDYKWRKFRNVADIEDSLADDIDTLLVAAKRWNEHIDDMPQWQHYLEPVNQLRTAGLDAAVTMYAQGIPATAIRQSFMKAWYHDHIEHILATDPSLKNANAVTMEQAIERYRSLAKDFQLLTRQETVAWLSARASIDPSDRQLGSELTLLRRRIANKGRGTSIRSIIDQMTGLLPRLCPIMLMSPLSVAQYINMEAPPFDIVIFDEASQMPTSEAIGAIARGKSVVVVGDPMQMPPTNFFSTMGNDDDIETGDLESILDDCIALSLPARRLRWHYRSRHESLIAFSNIHFYNGSLVTFPSAEEQRPAVTLQHVDGCYDAGATRTNRAEAEAVVEEAIRRMKSQPERSLGIVAFSKPQSDLIEDLLNERLNADPELQDVDRQSTEPLFVKNLENVQGDERDVILFSIGYGPNKEGQLSMNFGPLNKEGGERRLNVAITRARHEMKVFATLKPEDIDERRTRAGGVLALKQFLQYAGTGKLTNTQANLSLEDTDVVVRQISDALSAAGLIVHTHVGTSAFRVDIAVSRPERPDDYVLGIICDGRVYLRIRTVADREIVMPSVLTHLGWHLLRVWTIDWFEHPDTVIQQILKVL